MATASIAKGERCLCRLCVSFVSLLVLHGLVAPLSPREAADLVEYVAGKYSITTRSVSR
jgi:hypothetical protein